MRLKYRPDDFVVTERNALAAQAGLAPEPVPDRPWAVAELTKRGLTTPDAIRLAAGRLGLPQSGFRYAGLKDRQAVTVQTVTVRTRRDLSASWPDLSLRLAGYADRPTSPADITSNAFTVTVRDLSLREAAGAAGCAPKVGQAGFVNYFDDQRFGSMRADRRLAGEAIVRRDWHSALRLLLCTPGPADPRKERAIRARLSASWGDFASMAELAAGRPDWQAALQILVREPDAYRAAVNRLGREELSYTLAAWQSSIWNDIAAQLVVASGEPYQQLTGAAGSYLLWDSPPSWARGLQLSTAGRGWVEPAEPRLAAAAERVLSRRGQAPADFVLRGLPKIGLRASMRPLVVVPAAMAVAPPETDEAFPGRLKLRLTFELPSGSYATMLLKSILGGIAASEGQRSDEAQ